MCYRGSIDLKYGEWDWKDVVKPSNYWLKYKIENNVENKILWM